MQRIASYLDQQMQIPGYKFTDKDIALTKMLTEYLGQKVS